MTLDAWGTLRLNFRLHGYVTRQYLLIRPLDEGNGYTTTLPLDFSHNETLQQTLFTFKLGLLFVGYMGNVGLHVPFIVRWKARGQLPIRHN